MRRHIVQAFRPMDIEFVVLWSDRFEKVFKIRSNIRVGVFLNEKRCRSVAAKNREKAGRDILVSKPVRDFAADFNKTLAFGLNVQGVKCLAH